MSAPERVNILLVDDQQAKLLSHEAILAEIGENLLKATSAHQALDCLLKNEIALILIDVCMPDLDGFELAAMIREHPRFQATAIIFVSAVMMTHPDQLRGYQLGGMDYVSVPVVPELLRAKVKVFVDLYRKTRQLERFNAELEQRVAERTVELQRFNEQLELRIEERTRERESALAQLFEAQKMDTIGQLTGGVAHDFNNLLMAVLGSLNLLEKRLPEDPRSHRLLQNALQGAQRGAALTQRLLAFSRRQELKPEAVDIPRLVSGMKELLERALGRAVELQTQFQSMLPPVLVDANQLELALLNVALNARDAMPTGGTMTISAATDTQTRQGPDGIPPGDYVCISITDNGVGMDEMTLAKATEPFFTTKGPGKGTGLGLSMVHGLAAQSGGRLRISSELKVGTTLNLWLPKAKTASVTTSSSVDALGPPPLVASCRVLLVDDDALVMTGTSAMIEDLGHTPIEANSAADALAKLAAGLEVDVVMTDHAMPGMTGLQLAKCIQEKYAGLPVILATGYAELPGDPALLGLLRLAKPCNQYEIATAIQTALRSRPVSDSSGSVSAAR
jgi:signal transduction histidine kinase/ActR/RegA family two-component response regulator